MMRGFDARAAHIGVEQDAHDLRCEPARYASERVRIRGAGLCVVACAVLVAFSAAAQEARTEPQLNVVAPSSTAQPPAIPQAPT